MEKPHMKWPVAKIGRTMRATNTQTETSTHALEQLSSLLCEEYGVRAVM